MTGPEFKAWCKALGFTQLQAGYELGVSKRMVQKCVAVDVVPAVIAQACLGVYGRLHQRTDKKMADFVAQKST